MKEKIVAALLAFFLGEWGIHKFYLNEQESGKKYLIWCVVGILTSWLLIGLIPLVVLCVKDRSTFGPMRTLRMQINDKIKAS